MPIAAADQIHLRHLGCVFLLAGTVKGLVGLGLPTITIALTSLVLPLPEAIALIALPTIFTNVWQAAVGGKFWMILRRQWPLIVPLAVVLYLTMWLVGQKGPDWAFLVLAAVLILYSGLGLLRIRLHIHADLEKPLAPVIGVVSGFVAGVVGVPVVPADALPAGPRHQADRAGRRPWASCCARRRSTLTVSLLKFGLLDGPRAVVSAAAVVPAIAGMWLGQQDPPAPVDRAVPPGRVLGAAADGRLYFRQPGVVISLGAMLNGKRILLIVAGGIAAFKSLELIRLLRERGAAVRCVLTEAGARFVTPLSLQALSEDRVYSDMFSLTDESEMGHIQLSRDADLLVVAPATANILARMAAGLADDLASTVLLATDKPVLAAPAMNVRMWTHAATVGQRRDAEDARRPLRRPQRGRHGLQRVRPRPHVRAGGDRRRDRGAAGAGRAQAAGRQARAGDLGPDARGDRSGALHLQPFLGQAGPCHRRARWRSWAPRSRW